MGEFSHLNRIHARRQLGYAIILMLATVLIAFWVRLYVAYSPDDTGMPPTLANRLRLWAVPACWAAASMCALASSYRIHSGARPTPAIRYSATICLAVGTLLNYSSTAVQRLSGIPS